MASMSGLSLSLSFEEQFKPSTAPGGHYKPKIDVGGMENPKNNVNSSWHLHGTDNPLLFSKWMTTVTQQIIIYIYIIINQAINCFFIICRTYSVDTKLIQNHFTIQFGNFQTCTVMGYTMLG